MFPRFEQFPCLSHTDFRQHTVGAGAEQFAKSPLELEFVDARGCAQVGDSQRAAELLEQDVASLKDSLLVLWPPGWCDSWR